MIIQKSVFTIDGNVGTKVTGRIMFKKSCQKYNSLTGNKVNFLPTDDHVGIRDIVPSNVVTVISDR